MSNRNDPFLLAAIERQFALYARCLDSDSLEDWPGFFTEKCVYQITTANNFKNGYPIGMVYADSRLMLVDRVRSLRQANIYERQSYRHLLGRTLITSAEDGAAIETETPFMVARIMQDGQTMLFASGRYLDSVVADAGLENIALRQRIVVCDSSRIDTLLAIPL